MNTHQHLRLVFPACSAGDICEPFGRPESSLVPRWHCTASTSSPKLWPTIFMAVAVSTPALRRFVEAQWCRLWNRKPGNSGLSECRLERSSDLLKRSTLIRENVPCRKAACSESLQCHCDIWSQWNLSSGLGLVSREPRGAKGNYHSSLFWLVAFSQR